MCGISGIISNDKADKLKLEKMTTSIAHRGPDGHGYWYNSEGNVGFGHRRLSIIDLSEKAAQPMTYKNRYTITFNGEIYNYIELKKELEKDGAVFYSDSDTEVILALFDKYGNDCLEKLDGMFAFVIYDAVKQEIFGARDRFGEKPFYYHYSPGKVFLFCSEIKGLIACGIDTTWNNSVLLGFLETSHQLHNAEAPTQTFYRSVHRLEKAHYFTIGKDLKLHTYKYWSLDKVQFRTGLKFEDAKTEFKHLLTESVRLRLRSDVSVGSSLSGGLDSSTIVSIINTLYKGKEQHTFSARFENFSRDEGKYIELATQHMKVNRHYVWPDENSFVNSFQKMLKFQDEPVGTASIYAQYCVMEKAKEEKVTVLLDGQGADEILAGYEYYLDYYLQYIYHSQPEKYSNFLNEFSSLHRHLKFIDHRNPQTSTPTQHINPLLRFLKPKIYRQIKNKLPLPGFYTNDFAFSFDRNPIHKKPEFKDLNSFLKYSIQTDNLEDLLRYSDRNASAHSREVRLPFLSHHLVEFMFSLPAEFKIQKGWTKYILRESIKDLLPNDITWRVDKVGYEPPQDKWLQNPVIREMAHTAIERLQKKNIVNKGAQLDQKYFWPVLSTLELV